MDIRVEGRRPVGRLRKTWLDNVKAGMTKLEIDQQDVHDRKKWRRNAMKRMVFKSPTLSENRL